MSRAIGAAAARSSNRNTAAPAPTTKLRTGVLAIDSVTSGATLSGRLPNGPRATARQLSPPSALSSTAAAPGVCPTART